MRFKYESITLKFIRRLRKIWQERLTSFGKILFFFLIISSSFGSLSISVPFYFLACCIFGIFFITEIFSVFMPMKVRLEVSFPERVVCDSEFEVEITIVNEGKNCVYGVSAYPVFSDLKLNMQEKPGPVSIPAGGKELVVCRMKASRRGVYEIKKHRIETAFPFGVWNKIDELSVSFSVVVYPRFWPVSSVDIPVGRRYQPGGFMMSSNIGDSMEYIGDREYVEGDLIRNIHWNAWARLGKPVVKEFMEEYFCRIALILDTFVGYGKSSREKKECFESAVSVTASIADVLARKEYIVDIFAHGSELYYLRAGRSFAYFENILDLLSCVDSSPKNNIVNLAGMLEDDLPAITTFVIIFLGWDGEKERFCKHVVESGCALKRIIITDEDFRLDPDAASDEIGEALILGKNDIKGKVDVI
ncbi:MAG: DUF58 domain-containing protein [Candidatus Aureabacteria bacterium]|nr:DUF58 domain-containing protein [Candidatus Auribacterota bacterium]